MQYVPHAGKTASNAQTMLAALAVAQAITFSMESAKAVHHFA